ncbi:MAG: VaFE repeat-containing surface-anchored protein [Clostridia bacterium]|nr:VaFE repeat-containing surface-anchored protein [Clostridia bacterium]
MFQSKKGGLLRKGIAAFLLFAMMGSGFAFASDEGEAAEGLQSPEASEAVSDTTAAEVETVADADATAEKQAEADTPDSGTEAEEEANEFETVGTVKLKSEGKLASAAVEEIEEDGELVLFAQSSSAATSKKVKMQAGSIIIYENCATHNLTVEYNGKKIRAYCIEPAVVYAGDGTYTASPCNSALLAKTLYYSLGNPGYSKKTESYLSGLSRKDCYKNKRGIYAFCHIALSYVYDGEKSGGDAFTGVSSGTKTAIKKFIKKIKSWPDPPGADIGLSTRSVKAAWNAEKKLQETPDIMVTGSVGNSISVPVPEGAKAVCGDKTAGSGKLTVKVGESFHLTAPASVQGTYSSPDIAGKNKEFQPYIIKPSGKQDALFSISTINYVSYAVTWLKFGRVELIKTSSDEGITGGSTYYSLEGAVYGLYSKATGKLFEKMVTDEDGQASVENVPYGEYYLKEIKASRAYELDVASHDITVASPSQSETVLEKPVVPEIATSAYVAETGESSAEENEAVNISDTVEYSGVEPGMEYRIEGRLMNKATGEEIEGTESEVLFTPDSSDGILQMDYELNSSGLGGNTVVAYERLYQADNLIAVHEDLNNEAQSVNITEKPEQTPEGKTEDSPDQKPGEKTGDKGAETPDRGPDTGDGMNLLILAFALAASGLLGLTAIMKKN